MNDDALAPDILRRNVQYPRTTVWIARLLERLATPLTWLISPLHAGDSVRRILIVEPFRLGDAALLHVMLEPLRQRFPGAEIHILTQPGGRELYARDPRVAGVQAMEMPWAAGGARPRWRRCLDFPGQMRRLRRLRFDVGIEVRGDVRSQILMVLIGCRDRVGYTAYVCTAVRLAGRLLTRSAGDLPLQPRTHIHRALCALLGANPDFPDPAPFGVHCAPDKAHFRIVVHPGAGWSHRLWSDANWAGVIRALVRQFDVQLRLVGSAEDGPRLAAIRDLSGVSVEIRVTAVSELVDEIRQARLVLCLDSAALHLADAFDIPTVALFGPGVIGLYRPLTAGSRVVHHQAAFACAPCLQKRCVRPQRSCMDAITVEEVATAVEALCARLGAPRQHVDGAS